MHTVFKEFTIRQLQDVAYTNAMTALQEATSGTEEDIPYSKVEDLLADVAYELVRKTIELLEQESA